MMNSTVFEKVMKLVRHFASTIASQDVIAVLSPSDFGISNLQTVVFHVNMNASSIFFVSILLITSVVVVMLTAVFSNPKNDTDHINLVNQSMLLCGMGDLSLVPCFSELKDVDDNLDLLDEGEDDIEKQLIPNVSHSSRQAIEHAFSVVTLTFGTDKPEVYENMKPSSGGRSNRFECTCNHKDLNTIRHGGFSLTSTVSSASPQSSASSRKEVGTSDETAGSIVPEKLLAAAEGRIEDHCSKQNYGEKNNDQGMEVISFEEEKTEILVDTCFGIGNHRIGMECIPSKSEIPVVDGIFSKEALMSVSEKILGCTHVSLVYQWVVFNMFVHIWSVFKTILENGSNAKKLQTAQHMTTAAAE